MPRSYSRDIPMRRMPIHEEGALRSYSSRRGSTFIISVFSKRGHSAENAWRLTHQPSGGHASLWSYRECIELIRKLTSAPRHEKERWVIMSLGDFQGQVLFDRASGHWWKRGFKQPVTHEQLAAMSALRPIEAVSAMPTFQAYQLSLADQQQPQRSHVRARASISANANADVDVDADAPAHRGRPRLTMEERMQRWQAQHVSHGRRAGHHRR